ncbi:alpha/beta fold hydrolase [Nocardia sp. BMG111209]|uniref:alpha/beta fold hydrolase n=1 Tax=Nocardia sp. BMG111209 TaxID=1160137 RepID=UPI0003A65718|nr:alpha/beta fold hydrolase [Nocardia sp. BMG111209]
MLVHGILSDSSKWNPLANLVLRDDDLAGRVKVMEVEYPSKPVEFSSRKQIPPLDTVAGYLATWLAGKVEPDQPVVFIGHSQGGLIVQRYLVQELRAGRGCDLKRVRRVLMFATPNSGSEYFLLLRKLFSRNPQEIELRPDNEKIVETQNIILQQVVYAKKFTATTAPIPVEVYAGMSDRIVPSQSAKAAFPYHGDLPGDHSTIIEPRSADDLVYVIIKARLLRALGESDAGTADVPAADRVTQLEDKVDRRLQSQQAPPMSRFLLGDDAVAMIAAAVAEIGDLDDPATREQFVKSMPRNIQQRQGFGGTNPKLQLTALVRHCATFELAGRQALTSSIERYFGDIPAGVRAVAVIDEYWPVTAEGEASHTA